MEQNENNVKEKRKLQCSVVIALIAGISAIICVSILSCSFVNYKKYSSGSGITVTGSASCDFESDLIVWRGSFSAYGSTPKSAYRSIKNSAEVVKEYLMENGISEDELSFSSISISQRWVTEYNDDGKRTGEHLDGYDLYQSVTVTSEDVDKVDEISRDITKLIESNIEFESDSPEYYYTKLDELKLDLIEQATANAKARVDIIVDGTGSSTSRLLSANLGVFQITAQNSDSEYSYGGAFDTRSRNKTATITVKLNYATD
ncbi:MAG: SIMPL domain-containing protein [Lachnospiraceae bacterium]|nr:SIMPL domain-containing protein [Lachnospiraceae bacterium]